MDAAWQWRTSGCSEEEAIEAIEGCASQLREGRKFQPGEVEDAVGKVYAAARKDRQGHNREALSSWNSELTRGIHEDIGATTSDLGNFSPVSLEEMISDDFIERLFPGTPLLCCGWTAAEFVTKSINQWWQEFQTTQFIVPTIMLAPKGMTQGGKESWHTKQNTGPRLYVVVEFDEPPSEQHPSLVLHLSQFAPLTMALSSGGKSLHAWYKGGTEREMSRFFRYAAQCGADPALWRNSSQFVRTPMGTRDNGNLQKVLYFNPELCAKL